LRRFTDVCQAIEFAHDRGVLHRDLKPGNVMLGEHGETLVVDLGLAKRFTPQSNIPESNSTADYVTTELSECDDSNETRYGTFLGTPSFAPPEQILGHLDKLGPASDVFSLGAILYQVLTGEVPIKGTSFEDYLTKAKTGRQLLPNNQSKFGARLNEDCC
jgi:eukaryotic-like serine/threonine-protein kinase